MASEDSPLWMLLDEGQQMLASTAAQFLSKSAPVGRLRELPRAPGADGFSRALWAEMAELGWLGLQIPEAHGGLGLGFFDLAIVLEASGQTLMPEPFVSTLLLGAQALLLGGTDAQRARYLPKTLSGEQVGAMGMTEPAVGTDVLGMQSVARRDGDHYVLDGRKTFITNGPEADVFIAYAKLDDRITTFVIERGFAGFSTSPKIPKMGMRASTMSELIFDGCRVPRENLLGREGGGITNMMRNLEIERLGLSAMSLGMAQRCLDDMVRYTQERRSFGKPIHEHGQIQRYLAESYAKVEAMRALIYGVAATVTPQHRNRLGTDACKLFASTAAKEVADAAVQVLGGYGYCTEYRVEQFLRDAKLIEIGGGTLEAHQKNITRDLTRP